MHQHDVLAAGVVEAGGHRDLHAEVARELHQRDVVLAAAQASMSSAERSREPSSTQTTS